LAQLCRSFLHNPRSYWALDSEWKSFAEDWSTDAWLKTELASARLRLLAYLDEFYHLGEEQDVVARLIPVVTPIRLDIGESLVPDDTSATGPLLGTYIPALRERIRTESGVTVPGVKVQSKQAGAEDHTYTVLIDEIPAAAGRVPAGMQYTPSSHSGLLSLGISMESLIPEAHPVTGAPGCWVDAVHRSVVVSAGIALWEPIEYAIHHLEGVVRRHLAAFFGLQEAQSMLDLWQRDAAGDSQIDAKLSHLPTRLRVMRVLQSLVADRVPITAGARIIRAIVGHSEEYRTSDEIVRRVRLQFKDVLPGNESAARRVPLDEQWERRVAMHVRRMGDTSTLEVPADEAHRLVGEVRSLLQGTTEDATLVSASTALRPLIQRFLQRDFPDLLVLAQEELLEVEGTSGHVSQQSEPGDTATAS